LSISEFTGASDASTHTLLSLLAPAIISALGRERRNAGVDAIGIADVNCPDFGESVTIGPDEIPVFWACAVTPQAAIANAKPPFAITHSPGRMFVTDVRADGQL
jgi:uncharacterized protein YcsI (UPF0317 family)